MRNQFHILTATALLGGFFAFASFAAWPVLAQCDSDSECVSCSSCCPKCKLSIDKEAVKKHFYEVECKTICIPKVTFPWQKPRCNKCDGGCDTGRCDCPVPCKGAHVRTVKVLHKFEYECERCKYKWTPVCLGCDCTSKTDQPEATAEEKFAPPVPPPVDRSARLKDLFDALPLRK